MAKTLIAYYSRRGENYVNGSIISLPKGNTEVVVEKIKALMPDSDVFHIDTVRHYSDSYMTCIEEAKQELRDKARPEMKENLDSIDQYDTIILGYPNWWGDCPMIVYSFLEKSSVEGKTILPFCTHEGSGLGSTAKNLQKAFPGAKIEQNGLSLRGTTAQKDATATEQAVDKWLKQTGAVK